MTEEQNLFSEVVRLYQQKSNEGIVFPTILVPNPNVFKPGRLPDVVKANKQWLDSLLHKSGAILFRGFPVSTVTDFNDVVESSGYDDFSYGAGGAGARTKVSDRVYTANDSPPDQKIGFHHELSHVR